jgi:hypothetical protein
VLLNVNKVAPCGLFASGAMKDPYCAEQFTSTRKMSKHDQNGSDNGWAENSIFQCHHCAQVRQDGTK